MASTCLEGINTAKTLDMGINGNLRPTQHIVSLLANLQSSLDSIQHSSIAVWKFP
jgi:hypothetical protein